MYTVVIDGVEVELTGEQLKQYDEKVTGYDD